jgi:glycosyltransferase involved in cell wall biosynthesis
VPERDSSAIAQALTRLLDDSNLRARFSANAKSRIESWDQPQMVGAFSDAIEYVVAKRRRG